MLRGWVVCVAIITDDVGERAFRPAGQNFGDKDRRLFPVHSTGQK